MGRAPCCEKDSVKRGPWTPEEDAKLLACIAQYGTGSWRTLPKKAGLQRCGKSCRLRWTNYLRPDLKHGRFSDQEEQLIVKLHAALGSRWSLIAAQLPGRTDNDVKNYWNTRLKKKLCEMGIDPITHKPISQLLADLAGSMTLPKGSEIAEATLGCFKDDMLNVLMRRRPDTPSTSSTSHINMSFAPLDPVLTSTNSSCSPPSPAPITAQPLFMDKSHNFRASQLLNENSLPANCGRRKHLCTPAPCGPVSGIRSAAGAALAARNHAGSHPLSLMYNSSFKPDIKTAGMAPGLSSFCAGQGSIDHIHYTGPGSSLTSAGEPSSCNMLDMLLDQASYADFKEVPDLNLMQNHDMRHANYFDISAEAASAAMGDQRNNAATTAGKTDHGVDVEAIPESDMQTMGSQNKRMYTLLLQQQEKQQQISPILHQHRKMVMNEENPRRSPLSMEKDTGCQGNNANGITTNMEERTLQWSPVSYTNSGSSSSNLSLTINPHISPLDSVLTSDALLWDLSEFGSMVS